MKSVLPRIQKMRDEVAMRLPGDVFMENGTKVHSQEEEAALLNSYDDLIATLKNQDGMVAIDPASPQL